MKYPWLEPEEIEAAAKTLLARCFGATAGAAPLVDLDQLVYDHLCEHGRLSFTDERDLGLENGDQVLGRMLPLAGKIEITAALKQSGETGRYRFTVAHEIGHWVLHRPLFLAEAEALDLFAPRDANVCLTSLNRSVFPGAEARRVPPEEWQANRFAVDLLIDADVLREEFVRRFDTPVVAWHTSEWAPRSANLREHARQLAGGERRGRAPLSRLFGLSTEAMAIALEQRGYAIENPPIL